MLYVTNFKVQVFKLKLQPYTLCPETLDHVLSIVHERDGLSMVGPRCRAWDSSGLF